MYSVYSLFFSTYQISLQNISYLFIISQLTKIIFDIIFGFILNNISRKKIFVFACSLRLIAISLWIYHPTFATFAVGMGIIGIHMSSFFQHFEGYLYDICPKEQNYTKILGKYYSMMNLSILTTSFFLTKFDAINDINFVLQVQLGITILSVFCIILIPNNITILQKKNIFQNIKNIFTKKTTPIILTLVMTEGLFMSFANMISILTHEYSASPTAAAKLLYVIAIIKIPLNYISGHIKIKKPIMLNTITLILSLPLFILSGKFAIPGIFMYFILYTVSVIHIYNLVHSKINPENRMTFASIATILMSIFTIIFDYNIGKFGVNLGIVINIFSVTTVAIILATISSIFKEKEIFHQ